MSNLAGFPYFEVQFDKRGKVFADADVATAAAHVGEAGTTDLFVISHGWNNDMQEARNLYAAFFAAVRKLMDSGKVDVADRKFAVVGILWPSKKFADDDLKPSGAASGSAPISQDALKKQIDNLEDVFDNPNSNAILAKARQLLPQIETSPSAREQFADLIRSLPEKGNGTPEDASDKIFVLTGEEVMKRLSKPVFPVAGKTPTRVGAAAVGGAGRAVGLGSLFSGFSSAARNLLNYTTYYQMKERAGTVGLAGATDALKQIRKAAPALRIHLIGHSFGGRLVTAVALGRDGQPPATFASMTLLQAAFSHNGFATKFDGRNDGFFRRVVSEQRISGPILVTHTKNDRAVGVAYPIASLVAGQNAAALGDANDPFGGIGRNGAQKTGEGEALFRSLALVGGDYEFTAHGIHNLEADAFIKDHSDICKPEVAYALLRAVKVT